MRANKWDRIVLLAPIPWNPLWYLKFGLISILWFFYQSRTNTKKPWNQFFYGMINHKCEFDNTKADKEGFSPCKHYGCNVVNPPEPFKYYKKL